MPPKRTDHPAKRWCFTLNNYSEDELARIGECINSTDVHCGVVGKEVGDSGTPHLQGFIHLRKKVRFNGIKAIVGSRAHVEKARGTDADNEKYCTKDGDVPFRNGEFTSSSDKGGAACGFGERVIQLIRKRKNDVPVSDIMEQPEEFGIYIRARAHIEKIAGDQKNDERIATFRARYSNTVWRRWQHRLLQEMAGKPDERKIIWYNDPVGNRGKTFLSKYLVCVGGAVRFENGRSTDIKHAWRGERVCIFDLSRSQQDHINYEVIESVKNGVCFSGKYESTSKMYEIPHVVVFANWPPDEAKMSSDRWDVRHEFDEEYCSFPELMNIKKEPEEVVNLLDLGEEEDGTEHDPIIID